MTERERERAATKCVEPTLYHVDENRSENLFLQQSSLRGSTE
jgi:hypothetical protein